MYDGSDGALFYLVWRLRARFIKRMFVTEYDYELEEKVMLLIVGCDPRNGGEEGV